MYRREFIVEDTVSIIVSDSLITLKHLASLLANHTLLLAHHRGAWLVSASLSKMPSCHMSRWKEGMESCMLCFYMFLMFLMLRRSKLRGLSRQTRHF